MTKFRSRGHALAGLGAWRGIALLVALVALAGCATSSGMAAREIREPAIAAAYLPLHGTLHLGLDTADGAAMTVAPGIAATNAHNANLVDPKRVIGVARDYDLMFFRTRYGVPAPTAPVTMGMAVTAYGQGVDADLRVAHGVVRQIQPCDGCPAPAYFVFANARREADDAGPGFSGGPVVDGQGRLVGITFGYKDSGGQRLIYAYDMGRVAAELSAFPKVPN